MTPAKRFRSERAPAFQSYVADLIAEIAGMTAEERGILWSLSLHAWRSEGLPKDAEQLRRLADMPESSMRTVNRVLAAHFEVRRGRYVLPWQEAQRIEMQAARQRRQSAARRRWDRDEDQLTLDAPSISNADALHEESTNLARSSMQIADRSTQIGSTENEREPYPPAFDRLWAEYPPRDGTNSKRDAFKAWHARRREGERVDALHNGMMRYRAWCESRGLLGTERVMTAVRFFGPSKHYLEPYDIAAPALVNGAKSGGLEAQRAFDAIAALAEPTPQGIIYRADRIKAEIGSAALVAFKAVGGRDAFRSRNGDSEHFLRKDFERYYVEAKHGEAKEHATR